MNHFKENLKYYRELNGYTIRRLASVLNVSFSTISHYENGRYEPDLDMIIRISNLFDISLDELIL